MDEGETAVFAAVVSEYTGYILVFFENGKVAKIANVAQNTSLGIGKFSIDGIGKAGTQFAKSYIKEVSFLSIKTII